MFEGFSLKINIKYSLKILRLTFLFALFFFGSISVSKGGPPITLYWPVPGEDGKEWVINQYYDSDRDPGVKMDYTGASGSDSKAGDGHAGTDIDVPNFRAMDNDFPVLAAGDGVIEDLAESYFDRNMCSSSCGGINFVYIRHPNGYRTSYLHLKKNSVVVSIGDSVVAGQKIGVLGSSGKSTQPHLHFAVYDVQDNHMDPFAEGLWDDPPVYYTPFGLMDFSLQKGAISGVAEIIDPPENVTLAKPGEELGIGLSLAGASPDDVLEVTIYRGDNSIFDVFEDTFNAEYMHDFKKFNFTPDDHPGKWRIDFDLNSVTVNSHHFNVSNVSPDQDQIVRHRIPSTMYQTVFNDITAAGYRPVWVDGFNSMTETFFNAIFDKNASGPRAAYHDLDRFEYQAVFNDRVADGYRLVHVDSYIEGGFKYAAIFVKQSGAAWITYHEVSVAKHQALFDDYKAKGYRPVNLSFEQYAGVTYVTGLYDKKNVGSWVASAGLQSYQYQIEFDNNKAAGRSLAYLSGYYEDGVAKFSAIWDSTPKGSWAADHDLTHFEFQDENDYYTALGYQAKIVTGYRNGFSESFAGFWAK